jgi:hypothetical protein
MFPLEDDDDLLRERIEPKLDMNSTEFNAAAFLAVKHMVRTAMKHIFKSSKSHIQSPCVVGHQVRSLARRVGNAQAHNFGQNRAVKAIGLCTF